MIPDHLLFEFEPPRMGALITCLFICSYLEEERERDFYQLLSSAVPKDTVRTDLKRKHIDQLKQQTAHAVLLSLTLIDIPSPEWRTEPVLSDTHCTSTA